VGSAPRVLHEGLCQTLPYGFGHFDAGLVAHQGFAAPVLTDEGKQSVLDLVPLAGARR
jgi:hypothetical protein